MNTRRTGSASLLRLLGRWQQEHSRLPVYRQLAQALRLVILDGRLPLASRLPGRARTRGRAWRQPNHHRQRAGAPA